MSTQKIKVWLALNFPYNHLRAVGILTGFKHVEMQRLIVSHHPQDVENMLVYFVEKYYMKHQSWFKMEEALRTVGENLLADRLSRKYANLC